MLAKTILDQNDRDIFPSSDKKDVAKIFRNLSQIWHPDHNSDDQAQTVFEHLLAMREKALNRDVLPCEMFNRQNGTSFRMEYLRKSQGGGMTIYTGKSRIAYQVVNSIDSRLQQNAQQHKWTFASPAMKTEMERFISPMVRMEILDDSILYIFNRANDQILLRDLLDLNGVMEPVHVAWLISRMVNLICYLEWAKISHGGLSPETLLVSLDQHSVSFVGPMLYRTPFGIRPTALPKRTLDAANWLNNKTETADVRIDLALIRGIAMEAYGDRGGARIYQLPNMRKEIANWLTNPSSASAVSDYKNWEIARGPRKFSKFGKSVDEILSS